MTCAAYEVDGRSEAGTSDPGPGLDGDGSWAGDSVVGASTIEVAGVPLYGATLEVPLPLSSALRVDQAVDVDREGVQSISGVAEAELEEGG